jgi:cyclopropane fatty-acyl-phospholipid synthase-like methyltransferase
MWRRLSYAFAYRTGRTPWDTGITPPEVVELIEGAAALPPGRALDLGCGTGTNVAYLARHGWTAVGVDASRRAIDVAARATETLPSATVVHGDVTKLGELLVEGPFDLVLDIGCFHSIARHRRDDYAAGVAERTAPGATLFMFAFAGRGVVGVTSREMRDRFAPWFEPVGRIAGERPPGAAWYRLRRV